MNTRYIITTPPKAMGDLFEIAITDNFPARYNIAPSQPVPIIRLNHGGNREYALVRWGFVPSWDTGGTWLKRAQVNIRWESAPEKQSFRGAWRRRRCLFPVNGLYEWRVEGGKKQPYCLALDDSLPLFAVAGLWEHWVGADGSELETAGFLTQDARGPWADYHQRMPVIMPEAAWARWLTTREEEAVTLQSMLPPEPPPLAAWPVSPRVNSWRPDDAGLITPVTADRHPPQSEQQSLF